MRARLPYPIAPLTEQLPPELDLTDVRVFAALPLDPLIVECERCEARTHCRASEGFAKAYCRQFGAPDAPDAPVALSPSQKIALNSQNVDQLIRDTVRAYGSISIYELCAHTGLHYGAAKHRLYSMFYAGALNKTRVRQGNVSVVKYSLPESAAT